MLNAIFSAIVQILLFAFIPFLVFVVKTKSVKEFFKYVGLKKSTKKANFWALGAMLLLTVPVLLFVFSNPEFEKILTNSESVAGKISQMGTGVELFIIILVVAIFKTSFAEELFFRGFLAKRLIAVTNFQTGNILQAIIFGAMHTLLFLLITNNVFFLGLMFIVPALAAYFMVYLNEKLANGSIVPGWIAHGTANIISYSFVVSML